MPRTRIGTAPPYSFSRCLGTVAFDDRKEARADLFALYFIADPKMIELGLLPDHEAYKRSIVDTCTTASSSNLCVSSVDHRIEEAHMQ